MDGTTNSRYWTRVPESASVVVDLPKINVRNEPSTAGSPVAAYSQGERVNYDSYVVANGYVWISYISGSGVRRYMAIGEHDGIRRTSTWVHWV